jgi:hypothetical protein
MASTNWLAESGVIGLLYRGLASPSQRDEAGWATVHWRLSWADLRFIVPATSLSYVVATLGAT